MPIKLSRLLEVNFESKSLIAKFNLITIKGNAGLAAAYTAQMLKIKSTIFVPKTTSESVIKKLK